MQCLKSQNKGSAPEPHSLLWALPQVAHCPVAVELLSLTGEHSTARATPAAVPPFLGRKVPQAAAVSLHEVAAANGGGNSVLQKPLVLIELFLQARV